MAIYIWRLNRIYRHFPVIDRCRNRPETAFELSVVGNRRFVFEISELCHGSRDINISGFGNHVAVSGYRSLSQSLGNTFIAFVMVENVAFAVGISTLSLIILEI